MNYDKLGEYSRHLLSYIPRKEQEKKYPISTAPRILRILCQRPYFTGSGINLINLTKNTAEKGLQQFIIFGQPADEPYPLKNVIDIDNTLSVKFLGKEVSEDAEVPFSVAGMSDQMPYESTCFSTFDELKLETYLKAFAQKIEYAKIHFKPNVIHSHHLWLVSSLCRVLCPNIPVVATSHNTGLRQMVLAPHLAPFVKKPIQGLDAIAVIDITQQRRIEERFNFENKEMVSKQFFHIGQGINTDIFCHPEGVLEEREHAKNKIPSIIYVGKLSFSKGVPQLITAFKEVCREEDMPLELILVGSGKGKEKEKICEMAKDADNIGFLGQLEQKELFQYFTESDIFVLPSFYDGFPKVLLESLSSGCRAIITDLPGIKQALEKACGESDVISYLPLPEMKSIDQPKQEDIPSFVQNLKILIKDQLNACKTTKKNYEYAKKVKHQFSREGLFKKYLNKYYELISK